ncbi:MAG: hypothetical protein J6X28_05205 [Bacilli bacterium]|nr:hypothetical protein [Bacilli bacterium]
MNVGQYLQENFPGGVSQYKEITVNGEVKGYYVRGKNGDEMYLPANVSGNVGMFSYLPGAGGSRNDAARIRDWINSDNPPSFPVTIAAECSDKHNCIEVGYQVAKGANMNVTNNVTVCFSASGYLGISRTNTFEENHPDVVSTVISCEPYNEHIYNYKKNGAQGLIDSGSQVIFVAPSRFHINMKDEIKGMTEAGINAYFLQTAYSGGGSVHIMTNRDIISSGIIDYLLGYSDDFNKEPGSNPHYQLMKFNSELKDYENVNYDELANNVVAVKIPKKEELNVVDAFDIQTKESPVHGKYSGLKSIEPVQVTGAVMKTNYTYANEEMNKIRSLVKSSNFVDSFKNLTFRSIAGIPGCISGYLNQYYDIVGSLLNSLTLETDSILSYTQAVVDLDNDLANSKPAGTIVQDSELKGYIPIGLPEEEDEKEKDDKKEEEGKDKSPSPSPTPKSPGGGGGGSRQPTTTQPETGTKPDTTPPTKPTEPPTKPDTTPPTQPTDPPTKPDTTPPTKPTDPPTRPSTNPPTPPDTTPGYSPIPVGSSGTSSGGDGGDHSGAGYDGAVLSTDPVPLEDDGRMEAMEGLDDSTSSIEKVIDTQNYKKIPVTEKPIETTTSKSKSSVIPIAAGLGIAAAAGIGAKVYMDHSKNNDTGEEDEEEYDDDFASDEWTGDENTVALEEDYSARPAHDTELEEDTYYQKNEDNYTPVGSNELLDVE